MASHIILGYSLLYLTPKKISAVKFLSMTAINKDHYAGVGITLFKIHSYKILYSLTESL
jgi:hypothetical protein